MNSSNLFLSVTLSLPSTLQGSLHVLQLVHDFLLPKTIDAAVYHDLKRMVRLYGDSRVWTFRAMDGAAARGRLDIIQHLHYTRNEGCSPAAFTEAASHGHVEVVRWLYSFYQQKCWTCIAIKQAGMYGHIKVVKFLKTKVPRYLVAQAARFAAENNHMEVVDTLLADDSITTFTFAITCGQTDVVKLLLERGYINKRYVIPAMLRTNRREMMELLAANTDEDALGRALKMLL